MTNFHFTYTGIFLFLCFTHLHAEECTNIQKNGASLSPSFLFKNYCYSVHKAVISNWHEAKRTCRDNFGDLASIHSPQENGFILKIIQGKSDSHLWIGLHSHSNHSSFTWSDNSSVGFMNWATNYNSKRSLIDKCVMLDKLFGDWMIENCNTSMSFVCKRPHFIDGLTKVINTDTKMSDSCPDGWYTLGNNCYHLIGLNSSIKRCFIKSHIECIDLGANLVSIHTEDEQRFLTELVINAGETMWIGLYAKKQNSPYKWIDKSSPNFTKWSKNGASSMTEPHCVEMMHDLENMGKWKAGVCNKPNAAICKKHKDPGKCFYPENWSKFDTSCFSEVFEKPSSWLDAQAKCEELQSKLPVIHDHEVASFMKKHLTNQKGFFFWIGAVEKHVESNRDAWNNPYMMSFVKYSLGLSLDSSEYCLLINDDGKLDVKRCSEKLPFFCELSTVPRTTEVDTSISNYIPGSIKKKVLTHRPNISDLFQTIVQKSMPDFTDPLFKKNDVPHTYKQAKTTESTSQFSTAGIVGLVIVAIIAKVVITMGCRYLCYRMYYGPQGLIIADQERL